MRVRPPWPKILCTRWTCSSSTTHRDEPDLAVKSHGRYYAINATGPQARWNREAFKLLSQLFQMTVTDVPRTGVPSITIAK
jgi:hypothetical protein